MNMCTLKESLADCQEVFGHPSDGWCGGAEFGAREGPQGAPKILGTRRPRPSRPSLENEVAKRGVWRRTWDAATAPHVGQKMESWS
jgi:hypothetical protein